MDRQKTSRLFYNRFPYKVCIYRHARIGDPDYHLGWTLHACEQWLHDSGIKHKIYSKVRYSGKKNDPEISISASIFLDKKKDFDALVCKYQDDIRSVTEPEDQSHVDLLRENQSVIIRDRLYYDRYRYVIIFRRRFGEEVSDIESWLMTHFGTDDLSISASFRWSTHGWDPRLYLENEDDLVLTKMVWGDRIKMTTSVKTWSELTGA